MKRVSIRSVAISCFLFAAPSFAAADKALCSFDDGSLVVFGDIGVAKIKAQEFFCVSRGHVQGNVGLLRAKGHVLTWPRSRYLHQKTSAALLPV
ncbi:hypothetical protein [Sinorhizobium medicae]|uniref:hypothetical protein n=1 Tax=Sinorhizobium medicae TaxID=110321 RepID=UPI001F326451|nr:hypothetical protein [Sinorhizobium medicae]WQO87899.1 hypothetical protein U8C37_24245 [Sinorhizobium medicae]